MGIALVIVGGLIVLTFIPVYFDYKAKAVKSAPRGSEDIAALKRRLEALEDQMGEKDAKLKVLERDLGFLSRLIEDKSGTD